MEAHISRRMRARPARIFQLAVMVEDWPRILPHYRWVHVLEDRGIERIVDMAARREVIACLSIPLYWTSIQRIHVVEHTMEFEHIAGITRGMYVRWSIDVDPADPDWSLVGIRHIFTPAWPVPERLVQTIVGDYFVNGVARQTLASIAALAEGSEMAQRSSAAP